MQITFLTKTGTVLFVRDDIEQGNFVHEEYSLSATFPYNPKKVIQDGQRLYFKNISGAIKCFEIIKVTTFPVDGYQQIVAEHIVISELTDEHINKTEITDKTPAQALTTVLTGTLWSVGNSAVSDVNSVDISRGDVWQAVKQIEQNWNCHIIPRLTFNTAGSITGRYLDIVSPEGVFRGARLSVDLNLNDPSVTYDDSEVKTALYGYGGSVEKTQPTGDDTTEELTFSNVVWSATSDHPAKPSGQTYIEDPAKTALYGRNGRPRFGYYQNANIKDANVLLQKTWESLKASSDPKVTVNGTVSELYRLGYKGQPLNLYDKVIIELRPINVTLQLQIIKFDEDLVDPTASRPEIGAYIPNIIYINRETDKKSSGGGGGGRGRGSMTNLEDDDVKTWTEFVRTNNLIGMVAGYKNGNEYIKAGQIVLAINESGESGSYESSAYVNADHVNISATNTAHLLAGSIVYDANGKLVLKDSSGAGVYVERLEQGITASFGIWDKGNLTGGVMVDQINGQTLVKISGDVINLGEVATALRGYGLECTTLYCVDSINADQNITAGGTVYGLYGSFSGGLSVGTLDGGVLDCYDIDCADVDCSSLHVDGYSDGSATWQTETIPTLTFSNRYNFVYRSNGVDYTSLGYIVGSHGSKTIHYLGSATT